MSITPGSANLEILINKKTKTKQKKQNNTKKPQKPLAEFLFKSRLKVVCCVSSVDPLKMFVAIGVNPDQAAPLGTV